MSGWSIAGTYLEACNCEAICPCRRVGGRPGERSTTGTCEGALSWAIEAGHAGDVDLAGRTAVLALRYDEDEPGSPWDFVLYLDDRADERQHEALRQILLGELGGDALAHFPWAWKESRLQGVRSVPIEVSHHARRGFFRAGDYVTVRVGEPIADQEPVTCVIPGHERTGEEHLAETLQVHDGPLAFEIDGRCAYRSTFAYAG